MSNLLYTASPDQLAVSNPQVFGSLAKEFTPAQNVQVQNLTQDQNNKLNQSMNQVHDVAKKFADNYRGLQYAGLNASAQLLDQYRSQIQKNEQILQYQINQIEKLKNDWKIVSRQYENVKKALAKGADTLKQEQELRQKLEEERNALISERNNLSLTNNQLHQQIETLQQQIAALQQQIAQGSQTIQSYNQQISSAAQQLNAIETLIQARVNQIQSLNTEFDALRNSQLDQFRAMLKVDGEESFTHYFTIAIENLLSGPIYRMFLVMDGSQLDIPQATNILNMVKAIWIVYQNMMMQTKSLTFTTFNKLENFVPQDRKNAWAQMIKDIPVWYRQLMNVIAFETWNMNLETRNLNGINESVPGSSSFLKEYNERAEKIATAKINAFETALVKYVDDSIKRGVKILQNYLKMIKDASEPMKLDGLTKAETICNCHNALYFALFHAQRSIYQTLKQKYNYENETWVLYTIEQMYNSFKKKADADQIFSYYLFDFDNKNKNSMQNFASSVGEDSSYIIAKFVMNNQEVVRRNAFELMNVVLLEYFPAKNE